MPTSVILVLISFMVMAGAIYGRKRHALHISMMGSVMLFDLIFPVWLYLTHDWKHRLIDQGDILSFLVWAHFFLIMTLYVLYVLQIQEGKQLLAKQKDARQNHRVQSRGIILVRVFVFLSGALLIAPD